MIIQNNSQRLFFGIGANRSGTSWLHSYLYEHPECSLPALKELHYFNSIDQKGFKWRIRGLRKKVKTLERRLTVQTGDKLIGTQRVLADTKEWLELCQDGMPTRDKYLGYLKRGSTDSKLIGEITPAYAMLNADQFAKMAKLGEETRFVFVIRDPIDRFWSNIRMIARQKSSNAAEFEHFVGSILGQVLNGEIPQVLVRSDYAKTISSLEASVPREKFHVVFFENLFSDAAIRDLCEFLDIGPFPPLFHDLKNKAQDAVMPDYQRQKVQSILIRQYEFTKRYFAGNIPKRWEDNMN